MTDKTSLGDRMKGYESEERFLPLVPIIARIDGRAFHTFCRGMDRPFDHRMGDCMLAAARYVFEESGARIAYTQSDEISLLFYSDNLNSQVYFDGRKQKMISSLAASTTAEFILEAANYWPDKVRHKRPRFDCRVYQMPIEEVHYYFRWRVRDALKNSVSMAASAYFSHNQLQGRNQDARMDMLMEKGINWNNYEPHFKEGTFIQRRWMTTQPDDPIFDSVPERHRPTEPVDRRKIIEVRDFPGNGFESTTNMNQFLFDGAQPQGSFPLDPFSAEALNKIISEARFKP